VHCGVRPPSRVSNDAHRRGLRVGSIVIHCHEFARTVEFWRAALDYELREPAADDWVVLQDPTGRGPNLSFQARATPAPSRGWLHLDLYAADPGAEVERVVRLGAQRYPWRYPLGADYVVLVDPDGNRFCVVKEPGV